MQQLPLLGRQVGADEPGVAKVGNQPVGQVVDSELTDLHPVDRFALLQVELCRVRVDPLDLERLGHLLQGEQLAVVADRPAEQGEIVQQALGQETPVAVVL